MKLAMFLLAMFVILCVILMLLITIGWLIIIVS